MTPVLLFSLARQQIQYLNTRQLAVAQNISNASTPGYRTIDVKPFSDVMRARQEDMAITNTAHITPPATASDVYKRTFTETAATHLSGNNVSIEGELLKAGAIRRAYNLNTSVVKSFHKMYLTSVKA